MGKEVARDINRGVRFGRTPLFVTGELRDLGAGGAF